VNDPLIARFADACGAIGPLDLRVDLVGGGVLAEGSVAQPFTLIGRDDACDVTLSDPEINPRHAWLQVLGGRVFALDLGSRTGLAWPSGARGPGWLDVGLPVRIGPFLLRLRAPASDRPGDLPPDYDPLASDPDARGRLAAALEFKNGRRAKDRWHVNRLLTLVGRAADCKIHLTADDISPYHCGLVATPAGLWVVDLSGRGVVVNGERMRVAPLAQGAELWVGRFLIGCHYQVPPPAGKSPPTPPGGKGRPVPRPAASPVGAPGGDARVTTTPAPLPPGAGALPLPLAEDEVELGALPPSDELPASHIMADAFRPDGGAPSGSVSNPIQVSGSGPKSPSAPPPGSPPGLLDESSATGAGDDWALVPLLRQMADLHARTAAESQQSLSLVARAFARVRREYVPVLVHELTRIQELTAEIVALELEVARQTIELAAEGAKQAPGPVKPSDSGAWVKQAPGPVKPSDSGAWVTPSTKTPLPDAPTPPPQAPRAADRLAALQQDRAARWQALLALFAGM
jgi:pSer/pThr/pTyr-binding forkhead associated (FHA) protein